jgi:group I intron endonuclease
MPFVPNAEAVSCVYWVHRPEHTDILRQGYVGISKRFERRIWEHLKLTQNRYLKNAINKYGWDNLVKEKVLIGKEDYCLEIESKLRPTDKIGWNLVKGGNKPPINRWNAGTKGLMTSWLKGKNLPEETKAKVSAGVKKLWQDPEYRQHMSDAHKGKPSHMAGKKHSAETIEKIRLAKIGKKHSIETREKMSKSHQKRLEGAKLCQ